jgi:hypothetical protein
MWRKNIIPLYERTKTVDRYAKKNAAIPSCDLRRHLYKCVETVVKKILPGINLIHEKNCDLRTTLHRKREIHE